MAEWWQNLLGGEPPSGGLNTINYALKAVPQLTSPAELARNSLKAVSEANPALATFTDGLPDSILTTTVNQVVQNPQKGGELLLSFMTTAGLAGAANVLFPPKPTPTISNEQTSIQTESFSVGTQTPDSARSVEGQLNYGYKALNDGDGTKVTLGPLRFEVPPAMATVTSVHGGMGTVAPGAGSGISVRHVQNVSTMVIPGSVPLYQSLGIQGQMVEFVGAFLGFDAQVYHDASIHMGNTPGSNVLREDSPDPLHKEGSTAANIVSSQSGHPYGMGNAGSWAISRMFEAHIRRGEPMKLVIDTGVVVISYNVLVAGFDRVYQRDDRTWYKIQGMVVGSVEWVANPSANTGNGKGKKEPDTKKEKARRKAGSTRKATNGRAAGRRQAARGSSRTAAAAPAAQKTKTTNTETRYAAGAAELAQAIDKDIRKFGDTRLKKLKEFAHGLNNFKSASNNQGSHITKDQYIAQYTSYKNIRDYEKNQIEAIKNEIKKLQGLAREMSVVQTIALNDTEKVEAYTKASLLVKKRFNAVVKAATNQNLDPISDYTQIVAALSKTK